MSAPSNPDARPHTPVTGPIHGPAEAPAYGPTYGPVPQQHAVTGAYGNGDIPTGSFRPGEYAAATTAKEPRTFRMRAVAVIAAVAFVLGLGVSMLLGPILGGGPGGPGGPGGSGGPGGQSGTSTSQTSQSGQTGQQSGGSSN